MSALGGLPARRLWGKRLFDVTGAVLGLAALSPLIAVLGVLVKLSSPGPIIYRGRRVGLGGRDFEIFKLRTMWDAPSAQLTTALNDERVTPIGKWLRHYKLDELPQLVNILRGEMSFVGPRPEFREWVNLYSPEELRILSVRPGITDFASLEFIDLDQIVGESDVDDGYITGVLGRKNALRLRYLDEMSWRTDLRLIFATLQRLFRRH